MPVRFRSVKHPLPAARAKEGQPSGAGTEEQTIPFFRYGTSPEVRFLTVTVLLTGSTGRHF